MTMQPAGEKLPVQPGHRPRVLGMTRSPQVPGGTRRAGQVSYEQPPRGRLVRLFEAADRRHVPLRTILATVAVVVATYLPTYLAGQLIYRLWDIVLLMLLAGFTAMLLNPAVAKVQQRIPRGGPAVAIVTLCAALVFIGLAAAFGVPLVNGITHLAGRMPGYVASAQHGTGWIGHLVAKYHVQSWVQRNTPKLVGHFPRVRVSGCATVELPVLLYDTTIGRNVVIRNAIIDPGLDFSALSAMPPRAKDQRMERVIVAANARPPIDGGTVLLTGASAGSGRELAVQLAPRAKTLVLLARRAGRLEELRTSLLARHPQLQVLTLPVDLSDEDDVDRTLAEAAGQAGAVDVLVNNAGVGHEALADQADWVRVRAVLRTNVLAVAQLTTALVPVMVKRGRGGVLNMGSGAGLTVMPAAAAYSASKHFMDGFSEALRADLTGTGVVVTQVCPGPVDSEFDQVAGSAGGMAVGLPQFLRISAAQCAREALAGFDRGVPLVFPGRAYRLAMRALPLLPRELSLRQAARSATRLRRTANAPGQPEGQQRA
jgi:short-subunit dehydrogenase